MLLRRKQVFRTGLAVSLHLLILIRALSSLIVVTLRLSLLVYGIQIDVQILIVEIGTIGKKKRTGRYASFIFRLFGI